MTTRSEELAVLFQLTGVGVVQTDMATGRLVRANEAFCEMLGYREADLLGMTYQNITHPDDRARDTESFEALVRGESRGSSSLTRCLRKDGTVVWLELHVTVLGEGDQAVNIAVVNDVTERKRVDEALRESEEKFRTFVSAASDVVYKMSADWREMHSLVGKEFVATTENPREDWTENYIPEMDKQTVWDAINRAIETRSVFELEHRVYRLDGSIGWTFSRAVPVFDERGEIVEWIGAASDITEQKRADEALRVSEERYRALFTSIDEAYAVVEPLADENGEWKDFLFIEVNPAFIEQTGMEYPVGRRATELLGVPNPHWAQTWGQVAETGEPVRFEENEATLGRTFDLYAFRLDDEGSRVAVLFYDITERKRAEAALRDSEARQAFLLKLSDALRPLSDAVEIQAAVTESVMNYFGADRCYYCEIEGDSAVVRQDASREDLPSVVGVYPLSSSPIFRAVVDAGAPFVVQDVSSTELVDEALKQLCLQLQIISFLNVPVIKNAQPVGILCVTQRTPRAWTDVDVELLEEAAERTWAAVERARTEERLRASQERQAFLLALSDELRRFTSPGDIAEAAARRLAEKLGVTRVAYGDIEDHTLRVEREYARDASSILGEHDIRAFGDDLLAAYKSGAVITSADVAADARFSDLAKSNLAMRGLASFVDAILFEEDHAVSILMVQHVALRAWTEPELNLIRNVAERVRTAIERARAEAALHESQERLTLALEAARMGEWSLDLTTGEATHSALHDRIFGYEEPLSEWTFDTFLGHVHPDDRAFVTEAFERSRRTGEAWEFECRVVRADGEARWVWALERAQGDFAAGEGARMYGLVNDITERKRQEERQAFLLKLSDALRPLSDAVEIQRAAMRVVGECLALDRAMYTEITPDGETVIVNDNYLSGRSPPFTGEFPLAAYGSIIDKARSGEPIIVQDIYAETELTEVEKTNYREIDSIAFVTVPLIKGGRWVSNLVVHQGEPRRWTTEEIDMLQETAERTWAAVERARSEAALRELNEALEVSEQRFSQAFYANPIPACMTTFGRETFVEVNDALLALTGYAREEVIGKTSRELGMWSSPEDQKMLGEAQREGRGFHNLELRLRTKGGEARDILVSAAVIRLDGHDGYLKMFYDVTERRRTEEQLHHAIQSVMSDTAWFSRSVMERMAQLRSGQTNAAEVVELTPRERQVLERLAKGLSNEAIAEELGLARQTVRNYLTTVYEKIDVHSRAEAVVWARERGLVGL